MFRPLVVSAVAVGASLVALAEPAVPTGVFPTPLAAVGGQQQQREVYTTLSEKGSQPRVGLPDFAVSGATAAVTEAARTIAEVLWTDLEYEREFYMISRTASASIPTATSPLTLPFDRWVALGADYVLMGAVREAGGRVSVEIRLINVRTNPPGRQDFGQSYDGCTVSNPRFCAHSIADDMHKRIRDLDGIARTRVAFSSDRAEGRMAGRMVEDSGQGKEIFIMDYDGAGVRRLTSNNSLNIAPSWGPDGRTLTYTSYATRYPDIYVATLDGRPPSRPGQGTEIVGNFTSAISPDGTKVAFASNRGTPGFFDIWVVNRDGTGLRNLTPGTDRFSEGVPTWSPDGAQIAFTSDRTGLPQIFIMNADGTNVRRVTFDKQADRPTWSRLNFIAYTLRQPSGHDIAILDLSRMESRILTDGLGSNRQPTVSANGRHIVFVTTRWGKEHLASIDSDGKNLRRLTEAGNNTYPNWSPPPGGR